MIERAVRAEPSNASFLDSLGWVNFKLGKLKEAERYLSDAARRNPASATIQEHLGDLFKKLGQEEKARSEEHTSELQSRSDLVCRLLLEKKKNKMILRSIVQ